MSGWENPPPSSICGLSDLETLVVDDVARRFGRGLQAPGSGTPASIIAAEDAAEPLEDRVVDDALDDRDLEHQSVLQHLAVSGA